MSTDSSTTSEQSLSSAQREQLDVVCDAFESAWQRYDWPQAEDFLHDCPEPLYSLMLVELLKIEAYWRAQEADADHLRKAFERRFPDYHHVLQGILGALPQQASNHGLQQDRLGPFRDLEKIGDGGFGIVFRAWDTRHQRPVALKIPRLGHQLVGQELQQFLREAKAAGSLDHPNIARVWDSGTYDGVTYIAYQLVNGQNLKARIAEIRAKSPIEIADLVRQLAVAVHYAHEHGIVHRDIKPSNVLLTTDDQPLLTDFGLALAISGDATRSLAGRIGTLDYMSPEQARGAQDEIDERTDLWSLGVVLYELLTGKLPFQAATDIQLCSNICDAPHKRVRQLQRTIPKDLEVVVDRCLQKRPADRLASCRELAEELERIQTGKPIVSRRVSFIERSFRWCQRNPKPLLAFGVILLATIFGSWSWGLRLAEHRENQTVVQQLQLDLELKNVQRRDLLAELMINRATEVAFREEDLAFFEIQMFSDEATHDEQLFCAEILARNELLWPEYFSADRARQAKVVELIRELITRDIDQKLKADLQAMLPQDQS